MKRFFVLLVAAISMFATTVLAQGNEATMNSKPTPQRAEELLQTRLDLLRVELEMDEATYEKFEPVYRKYRSDIKRVTSKDAFVKRDNLTNDNTLKVVAARLHNQINTASVKQRYLHIFAEVIEPLKIERLYRIDERITREARKIIKYRNDNPQK